MPTIQEQLDYETEMVERGVQRFRDQQDKAAETRGHETSAGARLMRSYVIQISDQISMYINGQHPTRKSNRKSISAKLIERVDADKVAMFALREAINSVFSTKRISVQRVCVNIGQAIEDELRFSKFQEEYKEYYDAIIRDFERKNTTSVQHKRRVLVTKGADMGLVWQKWTEREHALAGQLVMSLLMEVCDLVEVSRQPRSAPVLAPTEACIDWVTNHNATMELLSPDRMPCIVPPADWVNPWDGGYYSARLRGRTPLVKNHRRNPERERLLAEAEMPVVLNAVNKAQRTAWAVNTDVLAVMQAVWSKNLGCGMPRSEPYEFPPCPLGPDQVAKELDEHHPLAQAFSEWKATTRELHTMEKERVAKNLALIRTLRLARELSEREALYFVYQLDFRGRMYCATSGLSPQGTDHSKSLLKFANGKALGKGRGQFWFVVNGANKLGYDKVSFEERYQHMMERADEWCQIASDPLTYTGWTAADKDYQFLAWCLEFAKYHALHVMGRGHEFVSHLPVGMDGSCNGLQHFSAMLRDSVGGKSVNLIPGEKPADIYQDVADVCYAKILEKAEEGEGGAVNWANVLPGGMTRKLPKQPVMTLPYGSTQQACTASIFKWAQENVEFPKNTAFRHSLYLNPLLWKSIGEVVVAARTAMDWMQDCASRITKAGLPISFVTPLGFPVYQVNYKCETIRIDTQIGGRLQLKLATETDKLDPRKQRQGTPPNGVHACDATHMMMTVDASEAEDFALIHDDYGVHAADTEDFRRVIQEQFVELHANHDFLQIFADAHAEVDLLPVPDKGDLDIEQVLDSPYFFG